MNNKMKVWFNGEIKEYEEIKLPIDVHALHYGSSIFEGIRAYKTKNNVAIFRVKEHIDRFFYSASQLRMNIKFSKEELINAIKEVIKENKLEDCYIRPIAFYSTGGLGLNPTKNRVDVAILAFPWGKYLKKEVRVKISTYVRPNNLITNPLAKIGGMYVNSILATLEAKELGYDEALMLDLNGLIAEGPGENIFFIRKEEKIAYTPPIGSILPGITRDTIIKILKEDFGFRVIEKNIRIEDLESFDEAFFVGTAAEVTPIKQIDDIEYETEFGKELYNYYQKVVRGEIVKYSSFLEFVY